MPMLERTAASLEPCTLRKLLPRTAKPAETSRTLHTCFWHHGAAEIELSQLWQALMPAQLDELDMFTQNPARHEPLNASTFLLEFLQPNGGALSFLRRLAPGLPDRTKPLHLPSCSTRPFTSLASSSSLSEPITPARGAPMPFAPALSEPGHDRQERTRRERDTPVDSDGMPLSAAKQIRRELKSASSSHMTDKFEKIWTLYRRLDQASTVELRRDVLAFLARSQRFAEASRICEIFDELEPAERDAQSRVLAIKAELTLQNIPAALDVFRHSVAEQGSVAGFGVLVTHALKTSSWELLADIWRLYKEKTGREDIDSEDLEEVALLPDLGEKVSLLSQYQHSPIKRDTSSRQDDDDLSGLVNSLSKMSLRSLDPLDAFKVVQALKDPLTYEEFIDICLDRKYKSLAAQAYGEYRELPDAVVRLSVLKRMLKDVFYPSGDAQGMEQVRKDWYKKFRTLNQWGYQKFLAFYASRGDVSSVQRLWNEFVQACPRAIARGEDTFVHLLKVHAVRGELDQLERVFADISRKYHVTPNTSCWNVRLHCYVEKGDYDSAIEVFENLCEAVEPDDYSFATLMALSGRRGDLDFTLELQQLAERRGIKLTVSMVDSVVEAYCQNGQLAEAQRLCASTTKAHKVLGRYTTLWNTLLVHHAYRRDLAAINRVLTVMTRFGVSYDERTYDALILGLVYCQKPVQAAELLRTAHTDHVFEPTPYQYTLLMAAYLRDRKPHLALQVNRLMHHMGFRRTALQMQTVMKAFGRWQEHPDGDQKEMLGKALRTFQSTLLPDEAAGQLDRSDPRLALGAVRRYSLIIFLLVQVRDFASIEELVDMYRRTRTDGASEDDPLPLKLVNALMLADFYEGKFDSVKKTWEYIFERTKEIGRPRAIKDTRLPSLLSEVGQPSAGPASEWEDVTTAGEVEKPKVVAGLRYSLYDPLKTMIRTCEAERDAEGLVRLMDSVQAAGFSFYSKIWNYYVQALARLERPREAFTICEDKLMLRWGGWSSIRKRTSGPAAGLSAAGGLVTAPDVSQLQNAPGYDRPTAYTLTVLARAYADLEELASWSPDAERLFAEISSRCMRTVNAIRDMRHTGSVRESRVFNEEEDDEDGGAGVGEAGNGDGEWEVLSEKKLRALLA